MPLPDQDPESTHRTDSVQGGAAAAAASARKGVGAPSDPDATMAVDPDATMVEAPAGSQSAATILFGGGAQPELLASGAVLAGRYEIISQLGIGGMGAVYKAHDREVQRDIALKVIRPELANHPQILHRFKQELILAREVTHPNVVRIYDIGEADGIKFITMKFVKGQNLEALMTSGKGMDAERATDLIYQVCKGLEAVHKQGIIHRDLKPGNIMIDEQGQVLLMDFGLARGIVEGTGMTQTGAMLGTMHYMSPEQAKAQPLDQRSDIYTVGLIYYEMLTGVSPYEAESAITSLMRRTVERAAPASTFVQGIPPALNEICSRCLEIDPALRFQNMGELLDVFDNWRSGKSPSRLSILARQVRRRYSWKYFAASSVLVGVLVAGAVFVPRLKLAPNATGENHAPVSVLVADFANETGDPELDGTLEPMLNLALEGAKFINAYSRGDARQLARKLPNSTNKLDEQSSRLVAVSQGIGTVVTGMLTRREQGYKLSLEALDSRSGKSIASSEILAPNKDELLKSVPKLAAPIRNALGDASPLSVQLNEVGGAFTAASLEVVHLDALGMEQQFAGKNQEALQTFSKAAQLDPNFARAYTGMSSAAANLGNMKDAEAYINKAMEHQDRMTERERYRYRGLYYSTVGDWQKCVDDNTELIQRYPADRVGQTNLSGCLAGMRQIPKALEAARRAVEIVPKGALQRQNLSYLSILAADFEAGAKEAQEAIALSPSSEPSYLALAEAHLGKSDVSAATDAYRKLEKMSEVGASTAASGLADLAMYEGRYNEAEKLLQAGIAVDLKAKRQDSAAAKFAALAFAQLARGDKRKAIASSNSALANSQAFGIRFLAARTLVEAGDLAAAERLASKLSGGLEAEGQAYGKIIEGMLALRRGQAGAGVRKMNEANALLNTWIGHFELGRAYLQVGAFVQADSEFDQCLRRRGEAIELFMDNTPTYAYFPAVYYYQGRVREGMKSGNFREAYRAYLDIREKGGEDPLLPDAKSRAQ